jgi:probable rRNA maturation factor
MPDGDQSLLVFRRSPAGLPRNDLRTFASLLRDRLAEGRSFCCLIADDRELLRLNRQFLGKDYPTDVLSFPSPESGNALGEIAISIQRADAQSKEFGHSLFDELRILMLHGVLHLAGMDHERDRGAMAKAERRWRKEFSLPNGLIDRASL